VIGQTLAHYRIVELVGRGGMGEVYRAEDVRLRRTVALKVLAPELVGHELPRERLIREACAASKLSHPNIATIYEVDEIEGRVFVSMEYIDGQSLAEIVLLGGTSADEVVDWGIQIADALHAAHCEGVIHRDVKPANVLLTSDGVVKVVDFGLALELPSRTAERARTTDATEAIRLTRSGSAVGTIAYMSPEQARGETPDARTDLFSLGVLLYEMTQGGLPFEGHTPLAMAAAIIHDPPAPLAHVELPPGLKEIILRCLQKDPANRPASAQHVRDALRLIRTGHTTGRIRSVLGRKPWPRRAAATLGLVVLAAVAGLTGFWLSRMGDVDPAATITNVEARRAFEQAGVYESRGVTRRDMSLAERMYRKALEREPDNAYLQAQLARFLAKFEFEYSGVEGRRDEIRELTDQALDRDPGLAPAWAARARLLLMEADAEGATRAAKKAVEIDPEDPEAYTILGDALIRNGQTAAGFAELERAVDVGQGHLGARARLARQLFDHGRLDEAAAEFRKILDYAPDFPTALNNLGVIALSRGNYVDAIKYLKRLLEVSPDDYAASNLGTAYFYLDRMEEAIEAFHRAVELGPDHPVLKQNLAEAYEKVGDVSAAQGWFAKALAGYDRILEQSGEGMKSDVLAERAFCAAKLTLHDEALSNVADALEQDPDNLFCLRAAARVHALVGNQDLAYEFLRRAVTAGYPAEELRRDPAFEPYRNDPEFLEVLIEPGS
jgi:non-specific serine/threonine protein kinase